MLQEPFASWAKFGIKIEILRSIVVAIPETIQFYVSSSKLETKDNCDTDSFWGQIGPSLFLSSIKFYDSQFLDLCNVVQQSLENRFSKAEPDQGLDLLRV